MNAGLLLDLSISRFWSLSFSRILINHGSQDQPSKLLIWLVQHRTRHAAALDSSYCSLCTFLPPASDHEHQVYLLCLVQGATSRTCPEGNCAGPNSALENTYFTLATSSATVTVSSAEQRAVGAWWVGMPRWIFVCVCVFFCLHITQIWY